MFFCVRNNTYTETLKINISSMNYQKVNIDAITTQVEKYNIIIIPKPPCVPFQLLLSSSS